MRSVTRWGIGFRAMLKPIAHHKQAGARACVAVVASEYNGEFVEGMLSAALTTLAEAGVKRVRVIRVPGAFEIPVAVATLTKAKRSRPEAVICLGVILRGKTAHADHVGQTVSSLLGQIAVGSGIPVIHEVLLLDNASQAKTRCLGKRHNRGMEAAQTALTMREVMRSL